MQLTGRRPVEGLGNVHHVGDDRLDAVPLALDLGDEARHLVPRDKQTYGENRITKSPPNEPPQLA